MPNSTTSAVYIPPTYTFTRPTNGGKVGSPQAASGNNTSTPGDPTTPTSQAPTAGSTDPGTESPADPATPAPPGRPDPVTTLTKTVEKTVKDPVGTVTQTLTKVQGTTKCVLEDLSALQLDGLTTCVGGLLNP
ncbi:hypothetical protein ASD66_15730 [Nocardioides sp. Root151]|nr:hypothetical protein ASD66_15730 [Nocardioides sp. Root151]KRF11852.1 hypothetical protein ASH02_17950 [Nocardioides sp. Soil796]